MEKIGLDKTIDERPRIKVLIRAQSISEMEYYGFFPKFYEDVTFSGGVEIIPDHDYICRFDLADPKQGIILETGENIFLDIYNRTFQKYCHKEMISTFLRKFNLHPHHYVRNYREILNTKLEKYSKAILDKFPFADSEMLLKEFITEDSKIHEIFDEEDDEMLTDKAENLDYEGAVRNGDPKESLDQLFTLKSKFVSQKDYYGPDYDYGKMRPDGDYDTVKIFDTKIDTKIAKIKLSKIVTFFDSDELNAQLDIEFSTEDLVGGKRRRTKTRKPKKSKKSKKPRKTRRNKKYYK